MANLSKVPVGPSLHGGNLAALPNPFCTQILPDALPLHQFKLHSPQAGVPSIPTLEEPTQDLRGTLPTTWTPGVEPHPEASK